MPTQLARRLRHTQTDAEQKLWQALRSRQLHGAKFRRQHPVGPYVTDFCCTKLHLILEIDGGHHGEQAEKDDERTAYLVSRGYRVLRFWNNEVLTMTDSVLERVLEATSPSPSP